MYQQFYGLEKNAFSLTPDPRFLVMTAAHREVMAALTYAILARKGFTVLTGDAGTGKTTLLRAVINSIPKEQLCFSFLVNPVMAPDEFYDLVLGDFGLWKGSTKPDRFRIFLKFLVESHAAGRACVLFVDEAHRLSIEMLEEIRLLTNFETESEKLLHIVLVGQDELDEMLDRRELRQLKQRVEVRQHIGPLAPEEVPLYISHRWRCAGGSNAPFSAGAVGQIRQVSGGIPRLINSICDNALLLGFAESAAIITEKHISEVSRDFRLNGVSLNAAESNAVVLNGTAHRGAVQVAENEPAGKVAPTTRMDLSVPPPEHHSYTNFSFSSFGRSKPKRIVMVARQRGRRRRRRNFMSKMYEALKKAQQQGAVLYAPSPAPSGNAETPGHAFEKPGPAADDHAADNPGISEDKARNGIRLMSVRLSTDVVIIPWGVSKDSGGEHYRIIRTRIVQHPQRPRIIAISSAGSGDGKTVEPRSISPVYFLCATVRTCS